MKEQFNHIIKVSLPYPINPWFSIPRKIGFSFDNMALFCMRERLGLTGAADLTEYVKKYGNEKLLEASIIGAAESYCISKRIKNNFTIPKLVKAVNNSTPDIREEIGNAIKFSQFFGISEKKNQSGGRTATPPKPENGARAK